MGIQMHAVYVSLIPISEPLPAEHMRCCTLGWQSGFKPQCSSARSMLLGAMT